ncbi:acyl-CoA carboxylase subunit epsilon [Planosporangium thailandense]|uniref:Acyl-CoA carboxylase subunit epsilon n=1 Tax=Planosporangium thailandense TaxID=765197 RepID=A0ABX0Y206_9ACTN|nr:acyl-CoA carboxylase subunit epsilon [Planosporangium thailandense]
MSGADDRRPAATARPVALVRGDATPEQLAAVMVVLVRAAESAKVKDPAARRASLWSERARLARRPSGPGPGAWRNSALPC